VLVEKLKEQEYLLNQQRNEQREMRSQPVVSENQTPENGAVNESDLVQVILQLQNDVCVLQHRPTIPVVAQPPAPIPIGTSHGEYATPMSGMSACAGFNPDAPATREAWVW